MTTLSDSFLSANGLAFSLPQGRRLFTDLTFGIGRERVGLVGPNGVGKTTLVRVLAGELQPTVGHVTRSGRVAYLAQIRTGAAAGTVADALGIAPVVAALERIEVGGTDAADYEAVGSSWNVRERAAAELARLGLDSVGLDRRIASLSGGEATRVTLAGLVFEGPEVALLDEPTNDLDHDSREALYGWVEGWAGGLVVISHDRELLRLMDRIFDLTPSGLRVYGGGYDAYVEQRAIEEEAAARELSHARKELKRTEREAQATRERQERRSSRGRRERQDGGVPKVLLGKRKETAESTSGRLADVGGKRVAEARDRLGQARERVEERERLSVGLTSTGLHSSRSVLSLKDVRYGHPGAAEPVLDGVSLVLRGPERVAVRGRNGSGKTTLLRLVMGELSPQEGEVKLGIDSAEVAYLDQRAALLRSGATVLECFREANSDMDLTAARYGLARYLFPGDAALARTDDLSGGERIRAALACTVGASRPPLLLLLDEPTNHLDLDSIAAVEDVLLEYDGALLVVSHDASFLEAIEVERALDL